MIEKQEREYQIEIQFQRELDNKKKEDRTVFTGRGSGVHDFFTIQQQQRIAASSVQSTTATNSNSSATGRNLSEIGLRCEGSAGTTDNSTIDITVSVIIIIIYNHTSIRIVYSIRLV